MSGKGLPSFPGEIRSGIMANATAVLAGQVLVYDTPTTDLEGVKRATGNNDGNIAGIALFDSAGAGTEIGYARSGDVPAKASGAVTAGDPLVAAANGGVKTAAAGNKNIIGHANTSAADGDVFSAHLSTSIGVPA